MPTLVPLGELSWNISEGYGGKGPVSEGRKKKLAISAQKVGQSVKYLKYIPASVPNGAKQYVRGWSPKRNYHC